MGFHGLILFGRSRTRALHRRLTILGSPIGSALTPFTLSSYPHDSAASGSIKAHRHPPMLRVQSIAWARNRPRVVSENLFASWAAKTFTSALDHQTCPSPHHSRIKTHPRIIRFGQSSLALADPCCRGGVPSGLIILMYREYKL